MMPTFRKKIFITQGVLLVLFLVLLTQRMFIYDRMNTFFKLYSEAWPLFALGTAVLVFGPPGRAGAHGSASTFSTRSERSEIRKIESALSVRMTPLEAAADVIPRPRRNPA